MQNSAIRNSCWQIFIQWC